MRIGFILAVSLLAACGTQAAPLETERSAEPAVMLTASGIAGFEGDVPFTLPAIERAFAGMEVVAAPDTEIPAFHVRPEGAGPAVFIVRPDWTRGFVGSVAAVVPGGSLGREVQAGVTLASDVRAMPGLSCNVPSGARDGGLSCEAGIGGGVLALTFPASQGDPVLERIAYFPPVSGD